MPVTNLTKALISELPLNSGIWRDQQVKGLMVVCHKTTKTFAVQGDVRRNGRHIRTVRVKIDRCDRMSLLEARRKAKELMSLIQSGVDPTATPDESGITLPQEKDSHLVLFLYRKVWENLSRLKIFLKKNSANDSKRGKKKMIGTMIQMDLKKAPYGIK